jgi:hypothetical protein
MRRMKRSAASRLATTFVVVASLLFMQLALASYACPVVASDAEPAMAMDMPADMHCEDMTPQGDQPVLCHQHCADAAQSYEPIKLPTLTLPAVVQVLVVPLRVDQAKQEAVAFAGVGEAQPPPSPVFLATLRLRV